MFLPVPASQITSEFIETQYDLTIAECCNLCRTTPNCVNWLFGDFSVDGYGM